MKKVPLVHYKPNGERVVVGMCAIEGNTIIANIFDDTLAEKINRGVLEDLSLDLSIAEATEANQKDK